MTKKFKTSDICKNIRKVVGKGIQKVHEPMVYGNEKKYLINTIKQNFFSAGGNYVVKFEEKIKKITKAKYAIAVVNCTEAIHIALKACGIKRGDEVLVPSLTFIGTVNPISYLGADPHFVESNLDDFGIDCVKLEKYLSKIAIKKKNKLINKNTKKTIKAIIPVHVFGHPCKIDDLMKIAKKYNLIIIEDAAAAMGSFYKKKHLGTFGIAGCISFNGNKIATSGGGGVVITNNKNLAKKILHLSTTSKQKHKWEYLHDGVGYNLRMSNINAALGLAQLENLKKFIKFKKNLYKKYNKAFKSFKEIRIFKEPKNSNSNYWLQTLILDKKYSHLKDKILKETNKNFIFTRPAWKLISDSIPYKKSQKMLLPVAKEIYNRVINLPSSKKIVRNKFS
tara:strand:- start:411 stop:1589 length:1179 start_codon:yes stop_codon:yes gene_type:complete